jgi:hypothetical protein
LAVTVIEILGSDGLLARPNRPPNRHDSPNAACSRNRAVSGKADQAGGKRDGARRANCGHVIGNGYC